MPGNLSQVAKAFLASRHDLAYLDPMAYIPGLRMKSWCGVCGVFLSRAKSDNLIFMKEITATDAARNFSDLLDELEHRGGEYVIVRRGKPVAHLERVTAGNGSSIKRLLSSRSPDEEWAADLASVRGLLALEERR